MLRKKLSKLIVAVMAAVMLSGGMSGVGQAAFANSNASVVTTEARAVVQIDKNTTEQQIIDYIKGNANSSIDQASTLKVIGKVVLTKNIVDAINTRITPLTIEVGQGGVLTINDAITLDGKSSSLKLVRVDTKSGAILETKLQTTGANQNNNVTIKGVKFENRSTVNNIDPYFINNDQNFTVTLEGNTISDGALAYDRRPVTGQTTPVTNFKNNNVGSGSLTNTQNITFSISQVEGATTVNVSGSTTGYDLIGGIQDVVALTVTDASGNNVGGSGLPLDTLGGFSGEVISGLKAGQTYKVLGEANYTDKDGNTYTRESSVQFTTYTFTSSVTNIGNNSATININHGNLPTSSYNNLTITVSGGTATPSSISATTNSINVTGLTAGTNYTYEIKSGTTVIDKGTFTTTSSTITGGGSTGGSVTTGDLTSSDINKADIKDVSVSIPVGSTTLANSLRDGRDYKTNIEGVTVTYSNGKVEFTGLVPEKDYRDLTITYTDKDGRTRTVKVPSFKTKVSETKLRQFIVDVYRYSLDRVADERGFAYWEDQLKNKKTSPDEFVKNLLNEREFINKHTTTTAKIEGLYQVIVNRKSDSQGLSFWTKKYDDLVKKGYSESMALNVIVDEMVNEQEFKNRVRDLGL